VHVTHDQEEAMTMADTVAVMNAGRIEQMGPPAELYEWPSTAFVANFLGQSNLLRAELTGRSGDDLIVEASGQRLVLPASRTRSTGDTLLVGIRPEKIQISAAGANVSTADDVLRGGVVLDASFSGVSTQYVVRMPWGQELTVFAQNLGEAALLRRGDEVTLSWHPRHAFGLNGTEDATAGVQRENTDATAGAVPVG
jgi:spermidine/putrescine transport system ATP-binding protein